MARAILGGLALALVLAACDSGNYGPNSYIPPQPGAMKLTVVVLVVDSLMPDEITSATPNLNALKTGGTFYPQSRAVFSAETIPNHVAMMTGVYPQRSGIATNNFYDTLADPPGERDLSVPEELTANTLFTWLERRCTGDTALATAATMSKKYLFEIFQGDAADPVRTNRNPRVDNVAPDSHWDPRSSPAYIGSPDEHTPDAPTTQQALAQLPGADFHFINLGDVDRAAHAFGPAGRAAALADTDQQVGRIVSALQAAGRWPNTVLFLVSDHGMDYMLPMDFINVQGTLDDLAVCHKPLLAIDNGGTDSIATTDATATPAEQQAALRAARACLTGTTPCAELCPGAAQPGNADQILHAWYTADDPLDAAGSMPAHVGSRHANLGALVLSAAPGFRFSEPSPQSNPIIGNHGHPATLHNTLIVSGGSPWVKRNQVIAPSMEAPGPFDRLPEQSENVDVAPTVAWLLGLNLAAADFPDGQGFDGRVLTEAFTQFDGNANAAPPTGCGRFN